MEVAFCGKAGCTRPHVWKVAAWEACLGSDWPARWVMVGALRAAGVPGPKPHPTWEPLFEEATNNNNNNNRKRHSCSPRIG